MKIKETEIKNSKIHALVYIHPYFSLVVETRILKKQFHMQLYMSLCCFRRITRLKS